MDSIITSTDQLQEIHYSKKFLIKQLRKSQPNNINKKNLIKTLKTLK